MLIIMHIFSMMSVMLIVKRRNSKKCGARKDTARREKRSKRGEKDGLFAGTEG
jgi:hypothetical protein